MELLDTTVFKLAAAGQRGRGQIISKRGSWILGGKIMDDGTCSLKLGSDINISPNLS